MQSSASAVLKDIVLVGGGHSHVGVLRSFGMKPIPGVRITLIGTDTHTPYSGMLPGYVAGHYTYDEVHIDLRRLATFAGARYFRDEVIGLDREARLVLCRHRPPVPYDVLSINTGSTPMVRVVPGATELSTPVKPIGRFNDRWLQLLERAVARPSEPLRIAVVGAGAGGVELLLSMQYRLQAERARLSAQPAPVAFELFSAEPRILPTHNPGVQDIFMRTLAERGVQVHTGSPVREVLADKQPGGAGEGRLLQLAQGQAGPFDEVMWVTQAGGPQWLAGTGLELDERGFVLVDECLQSVNDRHIFAAGDVATMAHRPLEKAGVFAVRQGKPLTDNLRRSAQGLRLEPYKPQRHWLALLGTGPRHAVASRGWLGFQGQWVWKWKEDIDRRFMRKFTELPAMDDSARAAPESGQFVALSGEEAAQALAAKAMRCGGCGAKVGASILSRALGSLYTVPNPDVVVGLDAPDDAAVVRIPAGKLLVHSVDFFRAFVDDPYVFGRIAANHALGDIYAMGGTPHTATAVATVPPGLESKVEDTVRQLMQGATEVLNAAGCSLIGGHTGEGQELALGFAVNGLLDDEPGRALQKGGMHAGQALILTKPVGTGTLMAAHTRMAARGRWIDAALDSMQISPKAAVECLVAHGASACTDLTGFGLLGHALEMTRASGTGLRLHMGAVPLLEGALDMVQAGIVSSLQPANVRLRRAVFNQQEAARHPAYALMFDPQTAGGMLAAVPADQAEACVAELRRLGYPHAAVVGEVVQVPAYRTDAPIELVP